MAETDSTQLNPQAGSYRNIIATNRLLFAIKTLKNMQHRFLRWVVGVELHCRQL